MQDHQASLRRVRDLALILSLIGVVGCAPTNETSLIRQPIVSGEAYERFEGLFQGYFGVRTEDFYSGDTGWVSCNHSDWGPLRKMVSSFVAPDDFGFVSITFSADTNVVDSGKLYVRALVDGVVVTTPDSVSLSNSNSGHNAVAFVKQVSRGVHTVQLECRSLTGTVQLREPTLKTEWGSFSTKFTARTTSNFTYLNATQWTNWPQVAVPSIDVQSGDMWMVTLSTNLWGFTDSGIEVRILANGVPIEPASYRIDANFDAGGRMVRFVGFNQPIQGAVDFRLQYRRVGNQASYRVGSWWVNLVAESRRPLTNFGSVHLSSSSDAVVKQNNSWSTIPGSEVNLILPQRAELSVHLSADVSAALNKAAYVRLVVDGVVAKPSSRLINRKVEDTSATSLEFSAKGLRPDSAGPVNVKLEWRVSSGPVTLGNRAIIYRAETLPIPDLAEDIQRRTKHAGVGPAVEIILLDLHQNPSHTRFTPAQHLEMFQSAKGILNFFQRTSNNKFQLGPINVSGWYTLDDFNNAVQQGHTEALPPGPYLQNGIPGVLDPADVGSTYAAYDNRCGENYGPFKMAGDLSRHVAIETARSMGLDLTKYDRNNDGVLDTSEVVIIIAEPWRGGGDVAGATREHHLPFCAGWPAPFTGSYQVRNPSGLISKVFPNSHTVVHWRGNLALAGVVHVLVHELGHSLFGFEDLYSGNSSSTKPGRIALMSNGYHGTRTSTLSAPHGLALGWYAPRLITASGEYSLTDLKDSKELLVLPRRDSRYGAEYFLISNRQEKQPGDPVYYDENIDDSGLAIWHVIEPTADNAAELYNSPQTCYDDVGFSLDQKIVRLIRPGNSLDAWRNDTGQAVYGRKLWRETDGVLGDRLQEYICADEANNWWGSQVLQWADGSPSGYTISDISPLANTMSLTIQVPSCENRCGNYDSSKVCQCDNACAQYGDCCFDRAERCL